MRTAGPVSAPTGPSAAAPGGGPTLLGGIAGLFSRYGDALEAGDAAALVAAHALPVTIWQDGRGQVFSERSKLTAMCETQLRALQRAGVTHMRWSTLDAMVSGHTAFVALLWRHARETDRAIEFVCRYTLRFDEASAGWLIILLVNEEPRNP